MHPMGIFDEENAKKIFKQIKTGNIGKICYKKIDDKEKNCETFTTYGLPQVLQFFDWILPKLKVNPIKKIGKPQIKPN